MLIPEQVIQEYRDGASTYELAEKYNTYPNSIRRLLKKMGEPLRDKSVAQSNAIKTGRHEHPTKGKPRSEVVKRKISKTLATAWENMAEEDKAKVSERAKENWNKMSYDEQVQFRKLAAAAVRKASKEGSKLEKYLLDRLRDSGYQVRFHATGLVLNENMHVDLYLPDIGTVIEIDGPTHFLPIWGKESLDRHITSDAKKTGLLLHNGFVLIRVKHLAKHTSQNHKAQLLEKVLGVLTKIRENKPLVDKRLIEIEVK